MGKKYVYMFSEGNKDMRELLGGKGANLAEMTKAGMPVPQGFTVSTEACTQYYNDGRQINDDIQQQIYDGLARMEEICGKKFADPSNPLLVSVRSGARASMPGMMDTILNLGLNDTVVEGFAKFTNNPRFAYDSYRRFIQMFSDVVMELPKPEFEKIIDQVKEEKGVKQDIELTAEDMQELVRRFKAFYREKKGEDFPSDPKVQLMEAVKAVFRSWDNPRANVYRRMNEIPYDWGTAVNVQQMVFGNSGESSGTGVAFTRNPATGEKALFGEYLINAQGEDVVAGVRTPSPISHLKEDMPEVYNQFAEIADRLEKHYKDMQDMEFTIESGKLYMLQTRNGKRTAAAALKVAVDLVDEGMIDEREAVLRVEPKQLDALLHPQFDAAALKAAKVIGKGLAASPGAACGKVVFSAEDAKEWADRGEKVVLVRRETSPEDIEGMVVAQGILTVRGGMTSHAAVVARGMGTCCVSGCGEIEVDYDAKFFTLGGMTIKEGDYISIDGSTGNIYGQAIPTVEASISGDFGRFMEWADKARKLEVYTNADTPRDAKQGRSFGAAPSRSARLPPGSPPSRSHRGCRLCVSYPEIAEMQTTAVINAAINVTKKGQYKISPNIMIPLVGEEKELKFVKDVVVATADKLIKESGIDMKYEVGTMIEIPRAALTADEIAKEAEFFSFGTNDLTQMTFGFSRDDAGKFLNYYYENKIYESDPFAHLDQKGVGKLVEMAVKLGRQTRPDIHLGICGEHGGDPTSVEFCHRVGLNYVSCSPFRVPIARLAAAQAAIKYPR